MLLRRGHTLAEALCALALSGVLAALSSSTLLTSRRVAIQAESRDAADRAADEAVSVLRAAIEGSRVLGLRGDTAIDVDLSIAVAPVCAVESRALLVPTVVAADGMPLTAALQSPAVDDIVAMRLGGGSSWDEVVLDSVQSRVAGPCGFADASADAADASAPRWRLVLRDTVATDLAVGDEVRIGRTGRFTLYHSGSGEWMLGWRRCAPLTLVCGVVQPIAGPLRPPSAGGLRIAVALDPERFEIEARAAGSDHTARATVFR